MSYVTEGVMVRQKVHNINHWIGFDDKSQDVGLTVEAFYVLSLGHLTIQAVND